MLDEGKYRLFTNSHCLFSVSGLSKEQGLGQRLLEPVGGRCQQGRWDRRLGRDVEAARIGMMVAAE